MFYLPEEDFPSGKKKEMEPVFGVSVSCQETMADGEAEWRNSYKTLPQPHHIA